LVLKNEEPSGQVHEVAECRGAGGLADGMAFEFLLILELMGQF